MGLAEFAAVKRNDAKNFPGPGQYQMKSTFGDTGGRVATIKHRHRQKPAFIGTNEDVGPCSYEIKSSIGEAPKYSMSGRNQMGGTSQTDLGPAYSPRQHNMASMPTSPRYTMGARHKKEAKPDEDGPGPASVKLPSTLDRRGITLGTKTDSAVIPKNNNPGPGKYELKRFGDTSEADVRRDGEGRVVSHTVAQERLAKPNPGPGEYDVDQHSISKKVGLRAHEKHRKGPLFGTKARPPEAQPCGAPGPAAYDIDSEFSVQAGGSGRKGKSMGAKPVQSSELESIYPKPGPGEYKIPSSFETSKTKGFSLASRIPELKPRVQVPGPGAYRIAQESMAEETIKSARGTRFNAHHKFNDGGSMSARGPNYDNQVPGPGSYEPKAVAPKPPSFTMSARDHRGDIFADTTGAPGPGTYNIKESTHQPGFTFYKGDFALSAQEEAEKHRPPGPGEYNDEEGFKSTKSGRAQTFNVHPPRKPAVPYYAPDVWNDMRKQGMFPENLSEDELLHQTVQATAANKSPRQTRK